MAFFSKLKERLFKSSSKLDEGLEAIVEDGGVVDTVPPESAAPEPEAPAPDPIPEVPTPEVPAQPDPAPQPEPEPEIQPQPEPMPEPVPTPQPAPTEIPTTPDPVTPEPVPAPAPDIPPAPQPEPEPDIPPQPEPAPEPIPAPTPEPVSVPAPPSEVPPAAPVEVPSEAPAEMPAPLPIPPAETASAAKPGLLGRLFGRKDAPAVVRRELDDDMLEQLEELLIASDMGVDTALRVTANMAEGRYGKRLSVQEIKELLATEVARIMEPVARPLPLFPKRPQVVLVVGVNGSGKTTTIGKLASQFRAAGKKVVIAAGDTFRAAAVEQLQVWGERAGVPVLTAPEGSDPASLAFDAMEQATRDGADLLMIDTAGRLQNRSDLMEELAKIVRVIRKHDETAPHNTLLVLDATTGQNALNQVKIFQEVSDVSGLVMTKLDGTAKGGVLVALADKFGLPIHAIGVGEQIDDLAPFDPEEFAAALTGLDG
ncbi:signal recognition particle-docking protein FtsY [Aliishimia ponticola]|uniref:Signal recognition particle receptor FtsY n=1 Tax=Aliishimia ponticola TaxID=2499833 RepID=A0A4S4NGT9_9RHOB|nr:signal recognition particle-docking protein FtsY [Aliishimia ponticola]THH37388.1 signal recognition particle-docking protein FtsY [Aliishimia ponticola]